MPTDTDAVAGLSRDPNADDPDVTMRVAELWRFPVKSLQGERLDTLGVTSEGLDGDRRYAIFDVDTGFGLTARRVPELLFASARLYDDGTVEVTLPDGSVAADDLALSAWLGRNVALRSSSDDVTRRYENPADYDNESTSRWEPFDGAQGAFHDSPGATVSLLSTASLGDWDRRRFRTNIVLTGSGEDTLVGSNVTIGAAVLNVDMRIERCVMVTRPQPDGVERDLDVLRTIQRERAGFYAVGALVDRPGTVRVGDPVAAVPHPNRETPPSPPSS